MINEFPVLRSELPRINCARTHDLGRSLTSSLRARLRCLRLERLLRVSALGNVKLIGPNG